jgi:hypothetical protein
MTLPDQPAVASWTEPEGLNPRGTVIVVPGLARSHPERGHAACVDVRPLTCPGE